MATKDQLYKRGILVDNNDLICIMCMTEEETLTHLFGDCEVELHIWRKVFALIGHIPELSFDNFVSVFFFCEKVKCVAKRTIVEVIWLATAWCLWMKCNAIIFKNELFSFNEFEGYIDANWNSLSDDSKATSGYIFNIAGGLVSWKSKKHTILGHFMMEFQMIALASASEDASWLRCLLVEISLWEKPMSIELLHYDSTASIAKIVNRYYTGKKTSNWKKAQFC
ncbi:uncharacterized protein LOC131625071 [Vicia villosa]|uniref:uncharacterized protein LOC131625071 n=1 Tax=Vicia villosa TaxID=3911 RepID=UPI00273B0229|nr:uncharacterized protein LOC131625071 [Vicia villosa]